MEALLVIYFSHNNINASEKRALIYTKNWTVDCYKHITIWKCLKEFLIYHDTSAQWIQESFLENLNYSKIYSYSISNQ